MNRINYDSPADIRDFLESRGWNVRKKWGQNFLINQGGRKKILDALDLPAEDRAGGASGSGWTVWEIGPGLGAMTVMIRPRCRRLCLFEIDPGYQEWLAEQFSGDGGVRIIPGDVLKTWKSAAAEEGIPRRIVGNLPYNAASSIIASLIEEEALPERMVVTVQKEMGERMTAQPRTSQYSSFSVLCQAACRVEARGILKPGSFYPVPGVSSQITVLEPSARWETLADRPFFMKLIRALFSSRRKTLRNNGLREAKGRGLFTQDAFLAALGERQIDPQRRPETVTVDDYIALANLLSPRGDRTP